MRGLLLLLIACTEPRYGYVWRPGETLVAHVEPLTSRLFVDIVADGVRYSALVDTGAFCALPTETATTIRRLDLGQLRLYDVPCEAASMAVLGNDVLRHFATTFDVVAEVVIVSEAIVVPEGATVVPLVANPVSFLIDVTIEGAPQRMLVDTGAVATVVREALLSDGRKTLEGEIVFPLYSAEPRPTRVGRAGDVVIGDQTLHGLALTAELGDHVLDQIGDGLGEHLDGLLGMDALRSFRFTVDRPNDALYLERQNAVFADPYVSAPIVLGRTTEDEVVRVIATDDERAVWLGAFVLAIEDEDPERYSDTDLLVWGHGVPGETRRVTLDKNGVVATFDFPLKDALGD